MTHNVRRFRIGLPSEEHVMGMKTASCIVVKGKGKDGSVAVRPYTPTTTNDTKVRVWREGGREAPRQARGSFQHLPSYRDERFMV